MCRMNACLVLVVVGALSAVPGRAESQESGVQQLQEELKEFINETVAQHQVKTNTDGSMTKGEVVFRWDNRERGSAAGCTAVWYDKAKRPVAIASVYPWNRQLSLEFDLIDRRAGAVGTRNDARFWNARDRDVLRFKPVPNAPKPASTEKLLSLQLKALARQFSVEMTGWKADKSDREVLRRLTTPVHVYGSDEEAAEVRAGAIILFVKGTDPEAALLLEAHSIVGSSVGNTP